MIVKKKTILSILLFALVGCTTPLSAEPHELVVSEYLLVGQPDISTDRLEFRFINGDQKEILKQTEDSRDFRSQAATYNSMALGPFGYSFEDSYQYAQILHGDTVIANDVLFMRPISVNASRTDFIGIVEQHDGTYVFTKNSFEKRVWPPEREAYGYVGDKLLSMETISMAHEELLIKVYLDDPMVYESPILAGHPTYGLTDGPWTYKDHWALAILDGERVAQGEIASRNRIVQDGQDLNTTHGYEQSFQFAVLDERPFYFFQKEEKIGFSFDGKEFLQGYDEIPHYNCCSGALLNPRISMTMIWFFARRGEDWYYVEAYVPINKSQ